MKEMTTSPVFAIVVTIGVYFLSEKLYQRVKFPLLNPVLVSIVSLMGLLKGFDISYEDYQRGTYSINLLLEASVVALAFPLYQQWELIRENWKRIMCCMVLGSTLGIISVLAFSWELGASKQVMLSLVPKSVTTPIAMNVSQVLGGIPPLTAAVVITVGIFGAAIGVQFLKLVGVRKPESVGLAMGTAAHGLGTARVASMGGSYSAMGGLAIAINGLLTALFSPYLVDAFMYIIS